MIPFLLLILVLFVIGVFAYNSLIGRKNNVDKAFAGIEALLKKRYDLIPNIIETAKVYMGFEKDLLTNITDLRSRAISGGLNEKDRIDIENQLAKQLSGLKVAVENYPDLKTSQNFLQLQGSWTDLEDQIASSRNAFNAAVLSYNNAVQMFPSNVVAYLMKFETRSMFEIPETERQNISAKELFKS
jgi:LemA protein